MIKHGWFSQKARENIGAIVYKTPKGDEVTVTQVTESNTLTGYHWDDTLYVGEVTTFVEEIPPTNIDSIYFLEGKDISND